MRMALAMLVGLAASQPAAAAAQIPFDDAAACTSPGPAVRVEVIGLKDRTGRLKLELFPANEDDFLKDDTKLKRQGKFFRRIWATTPASGPVTLCIRAPSPGLWALLFTHDRDGRNKFDFWKDGAGFPSNRKLGRSRPKLADALVNVGGGTTLVTVQAQYMRGLSGFAPYEPRD